ncbi:hypothetical protein ACIBG8_40105 [Nonomuraea sp. NPDC050556]|uniref:hypothetical protein n=1 Tax=Nonomuraea sp. NPDC050556 TaxID=3364369 RepID=UPI003790EF11
MSHTSTTAHKQTSKKSPKKNKPTTPDAMEVVPSGEAPTPLALDEMLDVERQMPPASMTITKRAKTPSEMEMEAEDTFVSPDPLNYGTTSTMLSLMDPPAFAQVTQQNPGLVKTVTKGNADYLKIAGGLTVASTPEEILMAAWAHPDAGDPQLWAEIGKKLAIMPGTWSEILGRTAHVGAKFADTKLRKSIRTFCREFGLNFADYENALTSEGYTLLGPGWTAVDEPGPTVALGSPADAVRNLVVKQLEKRHEAAKGGKLTPDEIGVREMEDDPDQRALDRLAWVLANLKVSRECVAVAKLQSAELRLFANVPDKEMEADFQSMLTAATEGVDEAEELTKSLFDQLTDRKNRTGDDLKEINLRDAERRLRKTLTFLQELSGQWQRMRVIAHTTQFSGAGAKERKVHAETQVGATAIRKHNLDTRKASNVTLKTPAKKLTDPPGLGDVKAAIVDLMDTTDGAELNGRLQQTEISIGISKLCCFYCWLMLGALAKTKDMVLNISATHFRTYAWPVPTSLTTKDILAAFLGLSDVDEDDLTPDQATLLHYLDTDKGREAAISAIKSTQLGKKGLQRTEYPSSDEEGETAPDEYTLSVDPPPDQVAARALVRGKAVKATGTAPLPAKSKIQGKPTGVTKTAKKKKKQKEQATKVAQNVVGQHHVLRKDRATQKAETTAKNLAVVRKETRSTSEDDD